MGGPSHPLTEASQPFSKVVSAVSTVSGTATFTFQAPPQGFTFTGTLSVPDAPTAAVFAARIGGTSWGEWGGNSVFGPVQAYGQQTLTITATGLTASTTYVMTWVGSSDPSDLVAGIWPDSNSTALTAQVSGSVTTYGLNHVVRSATAQHIGTAPGSTGLSYSTVLALNSTDESLFVQLSNLYYDPTGGGYYPPPGGLKITVVGNTTGFTYFSETGISVPPFATPGTLNRSCPVFGSVESVTLTISATGTSASTWEAYFTVAAIASSMAYVANPMPVQNVAKPGTNLPAPLYTTQSSNMTQALRGSIAGAAYIPPPVTTQPWGGFTLAINGLALGGVAFVTVQVTPAANVNSDVAYQQTRYVIGNGQPTITLTFPYPLDTGASIGCLASGTFSYVWDFYEVPQGVGVENAGAHALNVATVGGTSTLTFSVSAGATNANILAAPTLNTSYRIHSASIGKLPAAGNAVTLKDNNGNVMAMLTLQSPTVQLGGIICNTILRAANTDTAAIGLTVWYDVVAEQVVS